MLHAAVELRLYTPFVSRGSWRLAYLGDFTPFNYRMYNKSFTVDNVVAVVGGGRNIPDDYFEIGDTGLADLDVVTAKRRGEAGVGRARQGGRERDVLGLPQGGREHGGAPCTNARAQDSFEGSTTGKVRRCARLLGRGEPTRAHSIR